MLRGARRCADGSGGCRFERVRLTSLICTSPSSGWQPQSSSGLQEFVLNGHQPRGGSRSCRRAPVKIGTTCSSCEIPPLVNSLQMAPVRQREVSEHGSRDARTVQGWDHLRDEMPRLAGATAARKLPLRRHWRQQKPWCGLPHRLTCTTQGATSKNNNKLCVTELS